MKIIAISSWIVIVSLILPGCNQHEETANINVEQPSILEELVLKNVIYANPFEISPGTMLVNALGQTVKLEQIVEAGASLFLRIPQGSCDLCLENELNMLERENVDSSKVAIILSHNNFSSFRILCLKKLKDFKVFNLMDYNFVFPSEIEMLSLPYYFTISKNYKSANVYIAQKEVPQVTKAYLSFIKQEFKKGSNLEDSIFKERVFSVGEVKKNVAKRLNILFTNTSNKPLLIKNIQTDCGCVVVNSKLPVVKPGERSSITVEYKGSVEGQFHKSIFITTNLKDGPIKFIVHGTVI